VRVAIPVWNQRVSPVLDTAKTLMIVNVEGNREVDRTEAPLRDKSLVLRCSHIRDLNIQTLLCGAVSQPLFEMLTAAGIKILPWISGQVEEVLGAYLSGSLTHPRFHMPGCGKHFGRKRFRGGFHRLS
jgi:predicted Fe-Mo cluster-binding NifX family protein